MSNHENKTFIMIVEDDAFIAADIKQTILSAGYNFCATVTSGVAAIKKAEELKPDLILMDIKLPGEFDGIEAARRIYARLNIPVIFLTAHSDEALVERSKLSNPFGYLLKPFNEKELLIAIEIALYKHTMEARLRDANMLLEKEVLERSVIEETLRKYQEKLEDIVKERTAELEHSRTELRELAEHLQSIREGERVAIAREIHDELGQLMTALNIDMNWLAENLPDEGPLREKTDSMLGLIDTIIDNIWRISYELRPSILDELGLIPAIEWYINETEKKSGISCSFSRDLDDIEIEEKKSLSIYRIVQESLTNLVRHSRASDAEVELVKTAGHLKLTISDNGTGITDEQLNDRKSFGIIGMKERVNSMGGEITITGKPGRGTRVEVFIDLQQ